MSKRKKYSKEVEAAWFVLKEFIDPLTCSVKYETIVKTPQGEDKKIIKVVPMNYNDILRHLYSGTKVFDTIFNYSKRLLDLHLNQIEVHYYRSKRKARHCSGYGQSDKQAKTLIFAKELGITTKRTQFPDYYVILLGIDIDAHNNESDAEELADWLRTEYFTQSYWEPSTGGKGRHGYVKIAYADHLGLDYVKSIIEDVFELLKKKAELQKFKAPIDVPCGLPMSLKYDKSISKPESLPAISLEKFNSYRKRKEQLKEAKKAGSISTLPDNLQEVDKIISMKLPVSINQSQCIKLPRFNCCDISKANMGDIAFFYNLLYMDFDKFVQLRDDLRNELNIKEEPDAIIDYFSECDSVRVEREAPIVSSPKGNTGIDGFFDLNIPQVLKRGGGESRAPIVGSPKEPKEKKSYQEHIEEIRQIADKMRRTNKFYFYYSHYLGYVPDVKTAIDEYFNQKLNTNPDKESESRIERFEYVKKRLDAKWDLKQRGLGLRDWKDQKDKVISLVAEKLAGIDRNYVKDKKRKQIYEISIEELAFTYFAIEKSNQVDAKKKSGRKNSFSLKQVQKFLFTQYGKSVHRTKAVKILKILREAKLIERIGLYVPGKHGNIYKAVDLKVVGHPSEITFSSFP